MSRARQDIMSTTGGGGRQGSPTADQAQGFPDLPGVTWGGGWGRRKVP